MSRRSNRKTENVALEADHTETPSARPKKGYKAVKVEAEEVVAQVRKKVLAKSTKKKAVKAKIESEEESGDAQDKSAAKGTVDRVEAAVVAEGKAPGGKKAAKRKVDKDDGNEDQVEGNSKKKRKTKEEKEAEEMPLAARTVVGTLKSAMHIGAHVSASGGVQNSISNALHIGGNSFALFLKSQRKWTSPPLAPEAREQFKAFCLEHKYDAAKHVLPHGSYLVNLAQPDPEKATQAYNCFLDDLKRCEALGIKLYNFHPGSTGKHPRLDAIARIAAQLNRAHKATKTVVTLLENMAGSGNVIGSTWEDLRDIIALIDDKSRVGVCIDTCHTFAAGYDLRSPDAFSKTMDSFSDIVGMSYLKALHLNDSKAPLSSNRDLHANIGTGFLGLRAFHNVVNYSPFQDLPMVLETPTDKKGPDGKSVEDKSVWAAEIKLLESLVGADPETEEFKQEEQRLQDVGAEERKRHQGQVDKKQQKTLDSMLKKTTAKKKKAAKKDRDEDESNGSE
ncbi:apurinic endonuclease [Diplocarpon rosae]|nr:apurinic endonuclease [Diplocarpon rosae]